MVMNGGPHSAVVEPVMWKWGELEHSLFFFNACSSEELMMSLSMLLWHQ